MFPVPGGSLTRRLALFAAIPLASLLLSRPVSADITGPTVAAVSPVATSSFYVFGSFIDVCGVAATTECPLYNDAASELVPPTGGMTILDFGAPCYEPATRAWGTQFFNSQSCTPNSTVGILAQAWLRGYEANPDRSASTPYVLVVGTSNSLTAAVPGNVLTHDEMSSHGTAWFTAVISPLVTIAQGLPSPVTIWAGDDIEQSSDGNWYDGATTAAWVDAYAAASGATKPCVPTRSALLANYGDYVPNEPGWSPAAVYHVSWQSPPACPVPEIYFSVNANQWQSLNRYAVKAGLPPMQFTAVLSQDGALGGLTKSGSWNSLKSTTGQSAPYLTVIGLTGRIPAEVPDAPSAVSATPGPGFVMVTWSAPAWDGGAAVTAYTVTVYSAAARAQTVKFIGFPAPEAVVVTGLAAGIPYNFYVSASNRVGSGPQSLPSSRVVPNAPLALR